VQTSQIAPFRSFGPSSLLNPDVDALGNPGVLLYFQGDYAGAIPQLQTALKFDPGLRKIQALLGMAQKRAGDSAGSMANPEQAFPKLEDRDIQIEAGMELVEMYASGEQLERAAHVATSSRKIPGRLKGSLCVPTAFTQIWLEKRCSVCR
jgi:hypothetical protein